MAHSALRTENIVTWLPAFYNTSCTDSNFPSTFSRTGLKSYIFLPSVRRHWNHFLFHTLRVKLYIFLKMNLFLWIIVYLRTEWNSLLLLLFLIAHSFYFLYIISTFLLVLWRFSSLRLPSFMYCHTSSLTLFRSSVIRPYPSCNNFFSVFTLPFS
jgi:hypothetical protein